MDFRHPYHPASELTLCRLTLQADADGRLGHVSIGYLTHPVSGREAVYRERWLPHHDGDVAMSALLEHVVGPLIKRHEADFVNPTTQLRAVLIDLHPAGGTITVYYDVFAEGHEHQQRAGLGLQADSFFARSLTRLLAELREELG